MRFFVCYLSALVTYIHMYIIIWLCCLNAYFSATHFDSCIFSLLLIVSTRSTVTFFCLNFYLFFLSCLLALHAWRQWHMAFYHLGYVHFSLQFSQHLCCWFCENTCKTFCPQIRGHKKAEIVINKNTFVCVMCESRNHCKICARIRIRGVYFNTFWVCSYVCYIHMHMC